MLNLLLKELELKAKNRGIKDYKSMSIDKLLSIIDASVSIKRNKSTKGIRKRIIILIKYLKAQENFFGYKKTKIED